MSKSDALKGELWFSVFNGAITTHLITDPVLNIFPASSATASSSSSNLAFALKVTFTRSLWPFEPLSFLPPLHFHPHQSEYVRVLQGVLCVEIEGQLHSLFPGSGSPGSDSNTDAIEIQPWEAHRLYPPADFGGSEEIVFLLAGTDRECLGDCDTACRLDAMFFENWYAYQEDVWRRGTALSTVQVMTMFDAGGSYLACVPSWVPFSKTCALALGIVVGRWVGGIIGYQPYCREWTSDWDGACRRMRRYIWWRRFATQ
ncbi:hypothetical protein BDW72DRAFT_192425 [Aspergillus terricola var. indicus]